MSVDASRAESYALVSVFDKRSLDALAMGLARWYRIISLGKSAEIIDAAGVEVIYPEDFLREPQLLSYAKKRATERERREAVAVALGQRLCLPRAVLLEQGRTPIDLAYVNLMPPKRREDNSAVITDKGGVFLIESAVEGGRHILTYPQDLTDFLDVTGFHGPAASPEALAKDALNDLKLYYDRARQLSEMPREASPHAVVPIASHN